MPYVKKDRRWEYVDGLNELLVVLEGYSFPPGDLNYIITKLLHAAWDCNPRYDTGNELVGVLECAKQEFYRRKLAPYEDKKIQENGDLE